MNKIKHEGLSIRRIKTNPKEALFAEEWKKENSQNINASVLDYLLHPSFSNQYPELCTQEQATVAATVIQWLGSPVGWNFLEDCLSKLGYKLKELEHIWPENSNKPQDNRR